MAYLETGPAYIEQSWKDGVVKILVEDILTPIGYKDGQEGQHYDSKTQNIPWGSLSYFTNNLPNRDVLLSERYPTIGVAIPSHSCPERSAVEAADVFTMVFRKKSR